MTAPYGTSALRVALAAGLTLAIGAAPDGRGRPRIAEARAETAAVAAPSPPPPGADTVTAGGVTLTGVSFDLPTSEREYPPGPHVEAMNNNCLACHSAGMVLTQPRLGRAEWQGEVTKMVNVYKAPVSPEDVGAVVDYLAQLAPPR